MMEKTRGPQTIPAATLGEAWLSIAQRILEDGAPGSYDGLPMLELAHVTLDIATPDPDDVLIASYADPERLAWMRANFTEYARLPALGNADSYATRLYDYAHSGRDQIAWVIERLRHNPEARSATITTFQPLPDSALEQGVYAHSIDFGTKGYGNLVELAAIQQRIAAVLDVPVGRLIMTIKSAHIYATERDLMATILAAQ